jgi:hypothetical protein
MTVRARCCFHLVLCLSLGVPAYALTALITPSMTKAAADTLRCRIVNAGTKDITVTLEMINEAGLVVGLAADAPLPPGEVEAIALGSVPESAYCRFTGTFKKASVRASIDLVSDGHTVAMASAN